MVRKLNFVAQSQALMNPSLGKDDPVSKRSRSLRAVSNPPDR